MKHQVSGRKFSRTTNQRKALFLSLTRGLIQEGEIKTTLPKAKAIRSYFEKLVTVAKKGDVFARRRLQAELRKTDLVDRLVDGIAPAFKDRPGGYLRIIKLSQRRGDNALMAKVELVTKIEKLRDLKEIKPKKGEKALAVAKKTTLPEAAKEKKGEKNGNED